MKRMVLLSRGRLVRALGVMTLIIGIVVTLRVTTARLNSRTPGITTADVVRGDFVDHVELRGEVRPLKSILLTAPSQAGDLQIVRIARSGTLVRRGEVVVEFSAANLERTFQDKRSELRQSEAEIEKIRAQASLQKEQNATALMKAQYDVERAKLEVSKGEVLPKIDAEKAKLALQDAEQRLREIEQRLKADETAAAADLASRRQKRDKALFDTQAAQRSLDALRLHAPSDGLIVVMPNFRAGGMFTDSPPEFREGDRAWSGAAVAELPDLSAIRLSARLDETDRSRLRTGQSATARIDALPDREFSGRVSSISMLTKTDFAAGWPPTRNFDLQVELGQSDPRLRPGMSGTVRIAADRLPNVLLIPTSAVFQKEGRTLAYVVRGSRYEPREIQTGRRSSDQVIVFGGLKPGERVALKDPTLDSRTKNHR